MKTAIHPQYHTDAVTKCMNCSHEWKIGNTQEKIEVEICSNCHPFFTGKKVLIDTEGRADKFLNRTAGATGRKKKARKKTTLEERVNNELSAQIKAEKAKAEKADAKKEAKKAEKAAPAAVEATEAPAEVEARVETPEETSAE